MRGKLPPKHLLFAALSGVLLVCLAAFTQPASFSQSGNPDYRIIIDKEQGRYPFVQSKPTMNLQICGLEPGESYSVYLLAAVRRVNCVPDFALLNSESRNYGQLVVEFTAAEICMDFRIETQCQEEFVPFEYRVTVAKHRIAEVPKLPFVGPDMPPAISTTSNVPVEELIRNSLIAGDCFDVSNIVATGHSTSNGLFENGATSIGFGQGLILSSGNIANATGPNNAPNSGTNFFINNTDPDLALIASSVIRDRALLEFDFVPTQEQISFRYVFASEEYCEYVNSTYNDVFGFFLSGPGINGPFSNNGINLAVLPDGTEVAINNVNHLSNNEFYVPNIPAGEPNCNNHPLALPPATLDCQFDGFTVVLTATATVIPCETYHIKLAIADVGDNIYDSAVFFEENSFGSEGLVTVGVVGSVLDTNIIYEGCYEGCFLFTRTSNNWAEDLVVNFSVSPSSTAIPGEDFLPLPDSIVIPAGEESVCIPIVALQDGVIEGEETIVLEIENSCDCETQEVTMIIQELEPLALTLEDQEICGSDTVTLLPAAGGGLPGYEYVWSTGDSTLSIVAAPDVPTNYQVTVTDLCGNEATADALVAFYEIPEALLAGERVLCEFGGPASMELSVNFTGSGPWEFVYAIDSVEQTPVVTNDNPYTLTVSNDAEVYLVTVHSQLEGCAGTVSGIIEENEVQLALTLDATAVRCNGGNDGSLTASVQGNSANYTYLWSNQQTTDTPSVYGLTSGLYTLTVTDEYGCEQMASATIPEAEELVIAVSNLVGIDCNTPNGSATASVSGGTPGYVYAWSSGANVADPDNLMQGANTLTVTDDNGCTADTTIIIAADLVAPLADAGPVLELTCGMTELALQGSGSQGLDIVYQWSTSDGNIVNGETTLNPLIDEPGTYELLIANEANGCETETNVTITQDVEPPTISMANPDVLTCEATSVGLDATGTDSGSLYTIGWSTSNGNIVGGGNSLQPEVNAPGTYLLTVLNTYNNCESTFSVDVLQDVAVPNASAGSSQTLTCAQPSLNLDGAGTSTGLNFDYIWSTTNGNIVSGSTTPNPLIDEPGTYQLTILNQDNGCTNIDQVNVSQDIEQPVVDAGEGFILPCYEDLSYLAGNFSNAGSNPLVQWQSGNGSIVGGGNTPSPAINSGGIYSMTVMNTVNGCEQTDQVEIVENVPESLDVTPRYPPCFGDPGSLFVGEVVGGTPPYVYSIDNGQSFQTNTAFEPLPAGYYTVLVQDALGCETSASIPLPEPPEIILNLETTVYIQLGDSYQLQALVNFPESSLSYINWTPAESLSCADCLTPIATPFSTTIYEIQIENGEGCPANARVQVNVDVRPAIYVPNVFSPNADGMNDLFMIFAKDNSVREVRTLYVLSRWGETVFHRSGFLPNDPAYGWDGRHRGQPLNPAVFVWWAEVELIDGRIEIMKGDVTLVR